MKKIIFKCPSCDVGLEAPHEVAGKSGKCPYCGTSVKVPQSS